PGTIGGTYELDSCMALNPERTSTLVEAAVNVCVIMFDLYGHNASMNADMASLGLSSITSVTSVFPNSVSTSLRNGAGTLPPPTGRDTRTFFHCAVVMFFTSTPSTFVSCQ